MRRILSFVIALCFLFPASIAAQEPSKGVLVEQIENQTDKPGLAERIVAELFISTVDWFLKALGMQDPVILVFQKNPAANSGDAFLQGDCAGKTECADNLTLGVFEAGISDAIDALYGVFEHFVPFPLIIALILIGFLVLFKGASVEGRSRMKDYAAAFFVALLSLKFGYYLWIFTADIVKFFTDIIWAALIDFGVRPDLFLNMLWGNGAGYENAVLVKSLGVALIVVMAALMVVILNYQYIVRKIMLTVLMVLFPVTCALTVFPRFRHAMQIWWEEFISNMILPAAHALALGLFFLLFNFSSASVSVWIIIVYFFALPMIANMVRKLVGAQDSGSGVWGSIAGFAGLAGITSVAKMLRPRNAAANTSSNDNGSKSIGEMTLAGGKAVSSPTEQPEEKTKSLPVWRNAVTKAASYGGKVAGFGIRTAGAMAGFTVGTMTGFPVVGTMVGGAAAGAAGRAIGSGALWTANKAAPLVKSGAQSVSRYIYAALEKLPDAPTRDASLPQVRGPDAHFPADYRPAGEDFWSSVDLNKRYSRDYIVELHNTGKLDRHNELEEVFSQKRKRSVIRDYYV